MKTLAVIAALALLATPALADTSLLAITPNRDALMIRGGLESGSASEASGYSTTDEKFEHQQPWAEAVYLKAAWPSVSLLVGASWRSLAQSTTYPPFFDGYVMSPGATYDRHGSAFGFQLGAIFYTGK